MLDVFSESPCSWVNNPAVTALIIAAMGRIMVMKGPNMTYETASESAPFSGVEIKKDTVAPREAPLRRRAPAAGRTLQEQRGSGVPITAARKTGPTPRPPSHRWTQAVGNHPRKIPATSKPTNNHGAASTQMSQVFFAKLAINWVKGMGLCDRTGSQSLPARCGRSVFSLC